jgi:uncharacterized membrane protein YdjX (TVP38/TMEM64 family)
MNESSRPGAPASNVPWLKIAIVGVFAAAIIAFFAFGGQRYLSLEAIKQNRDALIAYTNEHYALALLIAFLVYTLTAALGMPGELLLSLTVGLLFGRWVGTVLVVFAATLGSTILFLTARYLFADFARRHLGRVGERINRGFTENAFHYMLFLRLVPVFPFFLVNIAPALTSIGARTYVLATFIGMIPGTFVFTNLGKALAQIESPSEVLSLEVLLALVLLGLFALIPVFVKRRRNA